MADPTDNVGVLSTAVFDKLMENRQNLGFAQGYYGDQQSIPVTPTFCVEPGAHTSEINGVGNQGRLKNTFEVFVLIYSMKIVPGSENLKISDDLAYAVRTLLHSDVKFGGLVHLSFVRSVEPGYVQRPGLIRACRLTLEAHSQTFL